MQSRIDTDFTFIDVSHYSGDINWQVVKQSGIQACYMKATEGTTYIDKKYSEYVQGAISAGILVGAYHFARPEQTNARDEAQHFVDVLNLYSTDLMPVLDLESPNEPQGTIDSEYIINWAREFIDCVQQQTEYKVMLYTGEWYINNFEVNGLGDIPLWISRYSSEVPDDCGGWTQWTAWQYTDQGYVEGVGTCDMSVATSLDAIRIVKGKNTPTTITPVYGVAVIDGDDVNLRNSPSIQGNVIRQLEHGQEYKVWDEQDNWLNLGGNQWIYNDPSYISLKPYVATIEGDDVNLRDSPSMNGDVIRQLHCGESYKVFAEENGWLNLGGNQWVYNDPSYIRYEA